MGISHHKQTIISHIVEEKKKLTKHLTLKAVLALMIHTIVSVPTKPIFVSESAICKSIG